MVFLKEFFEKVDFEKKAADDIKHAKIPRRQRINMAWVYDYWAAQEITVYIYSLLIFGRMNFDKV